MWPPLYSGHTPEMSNPDTLRVHGWSTFEPCHLHLVLSTCPTIMFFDLVIILAIAPTRAIRHVDNTVLGEGDKALKCLPQLP